VYVFVNAATSADGKLSDRNRSQVRLSSEKDFERVDRLRAESDAVMVGVGTVLADDPSLTVKDDERRTEEGNPTRVVADSRGRTPTDAEVLDDSAPTVVGVGEGASSERVDVLREHAEVVETDTERVDLPAFLDALEQRGVERLMVEGGGELVFSLLREGLIDEVSVYVAPVFVGGRDAPTLVDGEGFVGEDGYAEATLEDVERVGEGVVLRYYL
jgi:2,5-diamino-6-(ribosylamino)-4(3H)-pyrimidinone 5'-phosphate reductase